MLNGEIPQCLEIVFQFSHSLRELNLGFWRTLSSKPPACLPSWRWRWELLSKTHRKECFGGLSHGSHHPQERPASEHPFPLALLTSRTECFWPFHPVRARRWAWPSPSTCHEGASQSHKASAWQGLLRGQRCLCAHHPVGIRLLPCLCQPLQCNVGQSLNLPPCMHVV